MKIFPRSIFSIPLCRHHHTTVHTIAVIIHAKMMTAVLMMNNNFRLTDQVTERWVWKLKSHLACGSSTISSSISSTINFVYFHTVSGLVFISFFLKESPNDVCTKRRCYSNRVHFKESILSRLNLRITLANCFQTQSQKVAINFCMLKWKHMYD